MCTPASGGGLNKKKRRERENKKKREQQMERKRKVNKTKKGNAMEREICLFVVFPGTNSLSALFFYRVYKGGARRNFMYPDTETSARREGAQFSCHYTIRVETDEGVGNGEETRKQFVSYLIQTSHTARNAVMYAIASVTNCTNWCHCRT